MKVIINGCYGGFSVSKACAEHMAANGHEKAKEELAEWAKKNEWVQTRKKTGAWPADCPEEGRNFLEIDVKYCEETHWYGYFIDDRSDPLLVQAVEALGGKASGEHAELRVVEIPDGTKYTIDEYDGIESIHEVHRSWT